MVTIALTDQEHSTVLAALRFWQREGLMSSGHEREIAMGGGFDSPTGHPEMTAPEIDDLCEKLNLDAYEQPRLDSVRVGWAPDPGSAGEWCEAIAETSYPFGEDGNRRIQRFHSSGVGGVDRSDEENRRLIEHEELIDLKDHLERFGIDVSRFDELSDKRQLAQ